MKFTLWSIAATLAAFSTATSALTFGNHVDMYGLPSERNGGVWLKGTQQSVVFCYTKKAIENVDTSKFVVKFKKNFGFDYSSPALVELLTPQLALQLKGNAACAAMVNADPQPDIVADAPKAVPSEDVEPIPEEQQQEEWEDDRLQKRGIMTWSFVKDKGPLNQLEVERAEEGKCFIATFTVPTKLKSGGDYKFVIKYSKGWFGNKEYKGPKVFVVKNPASPQDKSWCRRATDTYTDVASGKTWESVKTGSKNFADNTKSFARTTSKKATEFSTQAYDAAKKSWPWGKEKSTTPVAPVSEDVVPAPMEMDSAFTAEAERELMAQEAAANADAMPVGPYERSPAAPLV